MSYITNVKHTLEENIGVKYDIILPGIHGAIYNWGGMIFKNFFQIL